MRRLPIRWLFKTAASIVGCLRNFPQQTFILPRGAASNTRGHLKGGRETGNTGVCVLQGGKARNTGKSLWIVAAGLLISPGLLSAQLGSTGSSSTKALPSPVQINPQQVQADSYQGSVADETPVAGNLPLSLDDAIQRGLRHNLGLILTANNQTAARSTQLAQLQDLLPTVTANIKEAEMQTDLQAQGLRIPGIPAIIGPYAYQDFRASLDWTLVSVSSLRNYMAAKHNFAASGLSLQDARNEVVLSVGNAYLLVIADEGKVFSDQAQVNTSKVSFDQAHLQHEAGTSPLLDELRAQVDYQTQQQTLIQSQATLEKDRLALARVIGLPTAQPFTLTDREPYSQLDAVDPDAAVAEALAQRKDLQGFREQLKGASDAKGAAKAERYPTVSFSGDYGDIGPNVRTSHGTGDASGSLDVPIFEEAKIRGDEAQAQQQLEQKRAQLSNLRGQIAQDVRDAILDIQAAEKQVSVAQSNVQLASEALSEAQQRYAAGVEDNLSVSQAQQQVAQADNQYVQSLYQHNVAKLSLARALGVASTNLKHYVGGK
jgi:outer membrane protein TolC